MMVAVSQSIPMEGISVGGAGEEVGEEMKGSISDTHLRPHPPNHPTPHPHHPHHPHHQTSPGWCWLDIFNRSMSNNKKTQCSIHPVTHWVNIRLASFSFSLFGWLRM